MNSISNICMENCHQTIWTKSLQIAIDVQPISTNCEETEPWVNK